MNRRPLPPSAPSWYRYLILLPAHSASLVRASKLGMIPCDPSERTLLRGEAGVLIAEAYLLFDLLAVDCD